MKLVVCDMFARMVFGFDPVSVWTK